MTYPTISVIIATFNSENTIEKCLRSVRVQEYPQSKIKIIISDGGSKDSTLRLVKKYKVKIISIPPEKQNAEYNKGVAINNADGELLLMIDHDNILPHNKWLVKMIAPFTENKDVVGVETLRYHYDRNGSFLDRYFALFGAGDPIAFYLGKSDRLSFIYDSYCLKGNAIDFGNYYIVKFDKLNIPTLGANGFMVRRKILIENAKVDKKHFFHIDVNVDLIRKGFNTYAFIKDDIIHLTGYKNLINFLYRRKLFMEQFHIKKQNARRYSVYMKGDFINLVLYIIYAVTFIKPLLDSVRGYLRIRDKAWFLHPILCFILLLIYSEVWIKNFFVKYVK